MSCESWKIKLTHHSQEVECAECSWPLYVGDLAREDVRGVVTCSLACARSNAREAE